MPLPQLLLEEVQDCVAQDERRLSALRLVRELDLPEGSIAGEFVRCAVFDRLHQHAEWTQLKSVDVVYFDPERTDPAVDRSLEMELIASAPRRPWRVRNLAAEAPEASSLGEALPVYPDTASAVAVCLGPREQILVTAPFGLEDLVRGIVRPSRPEEAAALRRQVREEKWTRRYPRLRLEALD